MIMHLGSRLWRLALFAACGLTIGAEPGMAQSGWQPQLRPPGENGGGAITLSLPESVALGLRNNRAIRSAYLERVAQKFDLVVAEDKYSPRLTINSSFLIDRNRQGTDRTAAFTPIVTLQSETGAVVGLSWTNRDSDIAGMGRTQSSAASLTIVQPLLRGAGAEVNNASIEIARLTERANQAQLRNTVIQTVTQIIFAYRELLRAQEQVTLEETALERARELIRISKGLIAAGRMAEVELVQAEANEAQQQLALLEARNQFDAARLTLLNFIALSPGSKISAVQRIAVEAVDVTLTEAVSLALQYRPDYLIQRLSVEQLRHGLLVARNDRLWDLSLVGNAGWGRDEVNAAGMPSTPQRQANAGIGLQLTIPLGDLTQEQAEIRSNTNLRMAEVRLEEVEQQIELQVRDAVRNVSARWHQLSIARRATELARQTLEIEKQKLRVGRSSNFQVLSFENDLRRSDNQQLSALIQYLNALTLLDQQTGTTLDTWRISLNLG